MTTSINLFIRCCTVINCYK